MKEILLTRGKVTLVDDEDYEWARALPMHAANVRNCWYAKVYDAEAKKIFALHRLIIGAPTGVDVDHIDGDGLNNQRTNLRFCSDSQNAGNRLMSSLNTSGFKGVSFHKNVKQWQAAIKINQKRIYLGIFRNPIRAALAYDEAARFHFGEFARCNFSKEAPSP